MADVTQAETGPGDRRTEVVAPESKTPKWRGHDRLQRFADPYIQRRSQRRRRILRILALMLVVTGTILGMLFWLTPLPDPFLSLIAVTQYEDRLLPFVAQGEKDREALLRADFFPGRTETGYAYQEQQALLRDIDAIATLSNRDPLVVYLSAYAWVANGSVSLLPANVDLDDGASRIPLRRVLDALKSAEVSRKLLVLDIMRPLADARLGVLADDVSAQIAQELAAVPDENRLVLCSCSAGQVSLTPEYLGRSAFSYYFEVGLSGWADGYNSSGNRNGQVTVRELAQFLIQRVDRLAFHAANSRQTPMLLGAGDDFALFAPFHGTPAPYPEIPPTNIQAPPPLPKNLPPSSAASSSQGGQSLTGPGAESTSGGQPPAATLATAVPSTGPAPTSSDAGITTPAVGTAPTPTSAPVSPTPSSQPSGAAATSSGTPIPPAAANKATASAGASPGNSPAATPVGAQPGMTAEAESFLSKAWNATIAVPKNAWSGIRSYWTVPAKPPIVFAYPQWLAAGWQQLDTWREQQLYLEAPQTFRLFEALLMRTEQRWRGGDTVERIAKDFDQSLQFVLRDLAKVRSHWHPRPRSLALAETFGASPDPEVASLVEQTIAQWLSQTAAAKPEDLPKIEATLLAGFTQKVTGKENYVVAQPIFDAATSDPAPMASKLRFLASLLPAEGGLTYIEPMFLRRLSETSRKIPATNWMPESIHAALLNVRNGERALSRPLIFDWLAPQLKRAVQARQNSEFYLFSPGYVPYHETANLIGDAARILDSIDVQQRTLEAAYTVFDEGLRILPLYVPYLVDQPLGEPFWEEAVTRMAELRTVLAAPDDKMPPAERRRRIEQIARTSQPLGTLLQNLMIPFESENIAAIIQASKQPRIDFENLKAMHAILRTPFLSASDRSALWHALIECSGRAVEGVLAQDMLDDAARVQSAGTSPDFAAGSDRFKQETFQTALRRAEYSIALLRMPGVEGIQELQAKLDSIDKDSVDLAALDELGSAIHAVWVTALPKQYASSTDLMTKEIILRIMPPFDRLSLRDRPDTDPQRQRVVAAEAKLWTWIANLYRYLSKDTEVVDFFTAGALDFERAGVQLAPEAYPKFAVDFGSANLDVPNPSLPCQLSVVVYGPIAAVEAADLQVSPTDDVWLQISMDKSSLPNLAKGGQARSTTVPMQILLKPGNEGLSVPLPQGFVLSFKLGEWTYHERVDFPVPSPFERDRIQILLSVDPMAPTVPLGEVRLRPMGVLEERFLFVRNLTTTDRKLIVQLTAVGDPAAVPLTTEITVPGNQTSKVSFGAEIPKPGTDLPALAGPLQIQLVDGIDKTTVVSTRSLGVRIADPRDYVEVSTIQFTPINPLTSTPNQLSMQLLARGPIAPPPCAAELVLSPDRIPGLGLVMKGTLRGVLPPAPKTLDLSAAAIQLANDADPYGVASVTIDGYARAFLFDVTFARYGSDSITPTLNLTPAIRLKTPLAVDATELFQVTIETDNAPIGATVDLKLGQLKQGKLTPDMARELPTPRDQKLGFTAKGPTGGLAFSAAVKDWQVPLDVTGISGLRILEARLLDSNLTAIATDTKYVTLDRLPPQRVRFLDLPIEALKSTPLPVRASGADTTSGVAQVFFFVGKPADGKVPMTVTPIPATALDAAQTVWGANLPMPAQAGPIDVSVAFVNKAGLQTFASATIQVVDQLPMKNGRILGSVLEANVRQPGLLVYLLDPKSMEKDKVIAKTTSTPTGAYQFDDVKPGNYYVFSDKVSTQRQALVPVTVEAGKAATVNLALSLQKTAPAAQ